jgi:hypothetical protein
MILAVLLGTIPLFSGAAIINATTVSGTMVLGLAPAFLLFAVPWAGRWAFHLGFWPGVVIGVLHVVNRIPVSWSVGDGPYAALLGANLVGTALVFGGFAVGSVFDLAHARARSAVRATAAGVLLVLSSVCAIENATAGVDSQLDIGGQTMLRLASDRRSSSPDVHELDPGVNIELALDRVADDDWGLRADDDAPELDRPESIVHLYY